MKRREEHGICQHLPGFSPLFPRLFYFEKVKRFGDVPWIDKTIEVTDMEKLTPRAITGLM